jgi:hypothetical protein
MEVSKALPELDQNNNSSQRPLIVKEQHTVTVLTERGFPLSSDQNLNTSEVLKTDTDNHSQSAQNPQIVDIAK